MRNVCKIPQFPEIRLACQVDKMTKFKLNSRSIKTGSIWINLDEGNLKLKSEIPGWSRIQTEYNEKHMQNARMPQFSEIRLACRVDKMTKFKLNSRSIQTGSIWINLDEGNSKLKSKIPGWSRMQTEYNKKCHNFLK